MYKLDIYSGAWRHISKYSVDIHNEAAGYTPSFAVIIPVHNARATLQETVNSIIPQLNEIDRLYLIENGSIDDSWEIVQEYCTHQNIVGVQIPKSGASEARNKGLELATQDYVMFCDADDLFAPDRMEVYRSLLTLKPETDFAYDVSLTWKGPEFAALSRNLVTQKIWKYPDMFRALLWCTSFFATSATVFKRQSLPEKLFSEGLAYTQDFEAWCYFAARMPHAHVLFVDAPLTYYRFEAGLSQQREKRMANVYHIVKRHALSLPKRERYKIHLWALLRLARQAIRNRSFFAAMKIIFSKPHPSIRTS